MPKSANILAMPLLALLLMGADRPPPQENDPDDFIRYIFETNGCVLTEAQLFKIYQDEGHGLMGANNAVIAVANREDIEHLSNRKEYTYRYIGSDYCGF